MRPRTAMVLAAGMGERMRPLTSETAKPLLRIAGKALIDHALDRLRDAGVELAVVNTHWQAERLRQHLQARPAAPQIIFHHEETLLDTGGAVRAALPLLGPQPFYVVNGDSFWLDGVRPALLRLADAWSDDQDCILLVHRSFHVQAEVGYGDFALDPWGKVRRPKEREIVPYVYAGVQLAGPALLADTPEGAFSMNKCWDRALARGRARAVVHDGIWFHLSTPSDLADAEAMLRACALGETW